ncbi:hypothetical protein MRS76_21095 [Rhizobiaceae bacterium n13]|uniref:Outer membrane protein beta-barrel domain-containing protein n=1 Tax=Ferirhizobium litorale TaxID=2927786 RepID=A0AAE3QFE6_9HYPH|nr:hypothetical protein [Fererhizobium litorale]MDI7864437.1 hypothetical protein [Fererhizobium litorale]MDI7924812.1 hypothetical protein [Fererhizobium litorale]
MKPVNACTLSTMCFLLLSGTAFSADVVSPVAPEVQQVTTDDGWQFTFAPYFWAAGMSGDTGVFGLPTVNIDADFGDIWDHLDFAAMAIGEARYGPYSIFADILYVKLSGESGTPRGILATEASVDAETFVGTLGAGYTILEDSQGRLDLVAGARVWSVDTTLSISGGLLGNRSRSDGDTWVDAVAGFKANYFLTPHIFLAGWGIVGGGGADIDWDVAGTVGYKFNDTISAVAGYRALGVDYSNDGFVFDVVQQGPILGVAIKF